MYDLINNNLKSYDNEHILYNKIKIDDSTYLYAYKDLKTAYMEEIGYINNKTKNDSFDSIKYTNENNKFGVIVFESNKDLDPLEVYEAYKRRWEIETMFQMMKGILDLDTVNVHNDYSVIATEFINFISVIMGEKVKRLLKDTKFKDKKKDEKNILDVYAFKQTMNYLSKIKMVRVGESDKWVKCQTLKYINELAEMLNI